MLCLNCEKVLRKYVLILNCSHLDPFVVLIRAAEELYKPASDAYFCQLGLSGRHQKYSSSTDSQAESRGQIRAEGEAKAIHTDTQMTGG